MVNRDPYLARIEAFNTKNGRGVTITKVRNGYTLNLTETGHRSLDYNLQAWMMKSEQSSCPTKTVGKMSGTSKALSYPLRKRWKNLKKRNLLDLDVSGFCTKSSCV